MQSHETRKCGGRIHAGRYAGKTSKLVAEHIQSFVVHGANRMATDEALLWHSPTLQPAAFEDIRYPENLVRQGALMRISVFDVIQPPRDSVARPEPTYHLSIGSWATCSINRTRIQRCSFGAC